MNDIISNKTHRIALDTNFLVDLDITVSPRHEKVLSILNDLGKSKSEIFITEDALLEYIHVVTDAKRFQNPFSIKMALERISYINNHPHFTILHSDQDDFEICMQWIQKYNLGRKRLTDTMMAATYFNNGITELWTANAKDFEIFDCFDIKSTV